MKNGFRLALSRSTLIRSSLLRSSSGQAIIEFVLVFPLLFLLVVNVVNFGGLLYAYITVDNAARSGASYMIMGPSSAYAPNLPSADQIALVVHDDMGSLPDGASAPVSVCAIGKAIPGISGSSKWITSSNPLTWTTCTMPPNPPSGTAFTDPQAGLDTLGTVQVQYTYCPFIKGWNFPGLGIYSTLPSCETAGGVTTGGTSITRVAAMRILQ